MNPSNWPKTSQPSSARTKPDVTIPIGQDQQPDSRITPTNKTQPLGDDPISTAPMEGWGTEDTMRRMTEDYGRKDSDDTGNAPLDGATEKMPMGEESKSYITTNFVK